MRSFDTSCVLHASKSTAFFILPLCFILTMRNLVLSGSSTGIVPWLLAHLSHTPPELACLSSLCTFSVPASHSASAFFTCIVMVMATLVYIKLALFCCSCKRFLLLRPFLAGWLHPLLEVPPPDLLVGPSRALSLPPGFSTHSPPLEGVSAQGKKMGNLKMNKHLL